MRRKPPFTSQPPLLKPVSVLIVEDHPAVRIGLKELLRAEGIAEVVFEAETASDGFSLALNHRPTLVILDLSLKSSSGLDLVERIATTLPDCRILVYSVHDDKVFACRAVRAGAMGYLNKQADLDEFLKAIDRILEGKLALSAETGETAENNGVTIAEQTPMPEGALSNREFDVYRLLGEGLNSRQIAEQLNLSIKTIESHRRSIKDKLGIDSGSELGRQAILWASKHTQPPRS